MRRATDDDLGQRHGYRISIHALHEESDTTQAVPQSDRSAISIHALHEESDESALRDSIPRSAISIHALHEESDSVTWLRLDC